MYVKNTKSILKSGGKDGEGVISSEGGVTSSNWFRFYTALNYFLLIISS